MPQKLQDQAEKISAKVKHKSENDPTNQPGS